MINILIADDHELIREGLKKILKKEPDMQVLGEAGNAAQVFEQVKNKDYNIVLLDISMPGLSGLDVLAELKNRIPNLRVLILSMHSEDRFALRALKAGAGGYVTKDRAVAELVEAIRKVVSGGRYVSLQLAEKLADELNRHSEEPAHETLSDREFQIMRMIAVGAKTSDIAKQLSLSISTVNTYRMRILEKMQMATNAELIRYAVENHLIA